jgi:hypothetical protein
MTDVDILLNRLAEAPADRDLAGLEAAVSRRIAQQKTAAAAGGLTIQMAVVGVALLLGLIVARVGDLTITPSTPSSEMVVLSDDSALAPSVKLEGGT